MRGLVLLLSAAFAATMLTQSVAQGAPAEPVAKGKVTIKVPSDGDATVAHLVLDAKVKKGKKPKAPVKRPRLKVSKAPKGVVVSVSYKRDKKEKNRWHASVAITNPRGGPALRSASSSSQTLFVIFEIVNIDPNYVRGFTGIPDIFENVVGVQTKVQVAAVILLVHPPGSQGAHYAWEMVPGMTANEHLEFGRTLGSDGPTTSDDFGKLGLVGVVLICSPFPGSPTEALCDFTIFVDGFGVNGIAIQFPGANIVTQLAPPGFSGVVTSNTVTWGSTFMPFQSGRKYRGNVRLNMPFSADTVIRALTTTTGGPPYSAPYPGNFVP